MPVFREFGALFEPTNNIDSNLNLIPSQVAPVQGASKMHCNIHRGTRESKDDALASGRDPTLSATGYFNVKFAPMLRSGRIIAIPAEGEYWRIMAIPSVRNRFPSTAHVRCELQLFKAPATGLPIYETTLGYGVGIPSQINS